jgi:hypothetical protein
MSDNNVFLKPIAYGTYKFFCNKYKIPLTKIKNDKRITKTLLELQRDIYKYERTNDLTEDGLYILLKK